MPSDAERASFERETDAPAELHRTIVDQVKHAVGSEGFQAQIYRAISVQRPVVLEYLRSLRRDRPDASVAGILKELDSRYVATVTVASTGVGASAAIPGVGIPLALGLGVADMLFFYETSAIYVLAVAELHGIRVDDGERARPLVLGMLLGPKSQSQINKLVLAAAGAGGVDQARTAASGAVGKALPKGWGDVLAEQIPDSALAPLTLVIGREALKASGKLGAGTLGKAIPFGVGAVIGGVGSFSFGRDVVNAARFAFPDTPTSFPDWLLEVGRPPRDAAEPSRAVSALRAAATNAKDFGEGVWGRIDAMTGVFRPIDLDGDGIPDEARAVTAVKRAGGAISSTAGMVGNRVTRAFRTAGREGGGVPDGAEVRTGASSEDDTDAGVRVSRPSKAGSIRKPKQRGPDEESTMHSRERAARVSGP